MTETETERYWKNFQTINCTLYFGTVPLKEDPVLKKILKDAKNVLKTTGDRVPPLYEVLVDTKDTARFAEKMRVMQLPTLIFTRNFREESRVEGHMNLENVLLALSKLKQITAQKQLQSSLEGWEWTRRTDSVTLPYLRDMAKYLTQREYEKLY